MHFRQVLVFLSILISLSASARILGIFRVGSRSHYSIHKTIVKKLLSQGHELTILSPFETNQTISNYTGIHLENEKKFVDIISVEEKKPFFGNWQILANSMSEEISANEPILSLPQIEEFINNKKIDLLMTEIYHTQVFHLLAHVLDVPLVIIIPPNMMTGTDYFAGNPYNPSYVPIITTTFTTRMNFIERVQNSIQYAALYWYQNCFINREMNRIARQYFNMELPPDDVLNRRTALVMNNNHMSFISRPRSPNVIDIGGVHIEPAKKLPKDLEEFIEGSPHGVILFSFGTTIKASTISKDKIKVIKETFAAIPQKVLWRVDDTILADGMPSNVKLSTWLPQRDILEHKNVVAFISHCGLLGTFEAIHTATPIIAIPIFFDQFQDAKILEEKGVGIYVDFETLDVATFSSAIKEVLSSKYRENMRTLSQAFTDRPISALDEAVYWIEYVLRHRGAPHLRTAAADMPLYQYLLLDVISLVLISIAVVLCTLKYIVKKAIHVLCKELRKNKME